MGNVSIPEDRKWQVLGREGSRKNWMDVWKMKNMSVDVMKQN